MDSGKAFYAGLLEALTSVMGSAKGYLRDHGPMVAMLASQLGRELGLSKAECSEIFFAAVLSDMGMVGLAEDAWENPAPSLTPEVRERVQKHPRRSEQRVRGIPYLEDLAPLLRHHHEWWNGSGYPDGLQGEGIPVGALILRIADTVSALGQKRPHRPALEPEAVVEVVEASLGTEFGPEIGECYLSLYRAGAIPKFDPEEYRHTVLRAAESLLPEEVSPLSTSQLASPGFGARPAGRACFARSHVAGGTSAPHARRRSSSCGPSGCTTRSSRPSLIAISSSPCLVCCAGSSESAVSFFSTSHSAPPRPFAEYMRRHLGAQHSARHRGVDHDQPAT